MENVLRLQDYSVETEAENKNISEYINSFFEIMRRRSENTYKTYKRAVEDFFAVTREKELDFLTEKDLNYTLIEVEHYHSMLLERYKGTTVNTKMASIQRFFGKMKSYGLEVNMSAFDVERASEHDADSYDAMTVDEIRQAIDLVKDTVKGEEKALFIRMAFATAFRKTSLLNLKWTDLHEKDGQRYAKVLGKGKKWDTKKISDGLWVSLSELKSNASSDLIFTFSSKSVDRMMNHIKRHIDFGERNITFHSLKKSSIQEMARLTGNDLKAIQRHGNHSDVTTTLNSYMSEKDFEDSIVIDIDYELPVEKFDELSKEELLELIKSSSRDVQANLLERI